METAAIPSERSPIRRVLATLGRAALTLAFVAVAVAVGIAGFNALSARAASDPGVDPAPLTTVAPIPLAIAEGHAMTRRFTGQIEAARDVALGFEEGGTVQEVLVREGERVAEGDVLARLDTRLLEAQRASALAARAALAAEVELLRRTDARQRALLAEGHVTEQRVDETSLRLAQGEARITEIDAEIAALDVRLSKAVIVAPFEARIAARLLDEGGVAAPGAAVLTVVEDAPVRFRVALDPALAETLERGVEVRIAVGSETLRARLSELAPEIDPDTRSRLAWFDVATAGRAPPSRSTGEVLIETMRAERGAWVDLSALRQGPRGTWTLLIAEPRSDGTAEIVLEAAEILHIAGARAFVRGTFADGALVLPAGTHRVVPGEAVLLAEAQ